jgi:organic hydroperoxide reductase OsmC/OhrA
MDAHETNGPRVTLAREENFRFRVRFDGGGGAVLITDEAPPLGGGAGPNPSELLAAAVGNCLASSLLFCVRKAHVEVGGLEVEVRSSLVREGGRMRIGSMLATVVPIVDGSSWQRMDRCLGLFESFCMVTESVRRGIPIAVVIEPRELAAGAAHG